MISVCVCCGSLMQLCDENGVVDHDCKDDTRYIYRT